RAAAPGRVRAGARPGESGAAGAAARELSPREERRPMDSIFTDLDRMRGKASRVALATLVATRGTAPKKEGARMWVDEEGRIVGAVTIGGCVDAKVVEEAERVLATSSPKLLSVALGDEEA